MEKEFDQGDAVNTLGNKHAIVSLRYNLVETMCNASFAYLSCEQSFVLVHRKTNKSIPI